MRSGPKATHLTSNGFESLPDRAPFLKHYAKGTKLIPNHFLHQSLARELGSDDSTLEVRLKVQKTTCRPAGWDGGVWNELMVLMVTDSGNSLGRSPLYLILTVMRFW